jgi:hypothetical protein
VSNSTDASGDPAVTFTFLGSASHPTLDGNDLVVYLSTGAAGLSDTSTLSDDADGGREAVSGYNGNAAPNGPRSLVTFPSGFQATYAVSIEDSFVGLFHLVNLTSPPSLDYEGQNANPSTGVTESSDNGNAPYGDTITIPLSVIGLAPGQSFELDGTDNADSSYRSNEAIGPSDAPSGGTNIGFTGTLDFTGYDTFTTAPEPTSAAIISFGIAGLALRRRRSCTISPRQTR